MLKSAIWVISIYSINVCLSQGILYPQDSETRQVRKIDGIWHFRVSNDSLLGFRQRWYSEPLSKSGSVIPMPVPSSYNDITVEKNIREHVGLVWYERTFYVPDTWRKQAYRVWLRFGSVHYIAQVWVNGQKVMYHEIGHLPFQREITSVLHFGAENRVTVAVDNTLTSSTVPQGYVDKIHTMDGVKTVQRYSFDFFNYAGIHRSVHLYTTPQIYIDDITVETDISGTTGIVYYNVSLGGLQSSNDEISCRVDLLDSDGVSVAHNTVVDNDNGFIGKLDVPDAKLWWPYLVDPNPGYLYKLEVRLSSAQWGLEDVYRLPVGIRTIHWTNVSLLINDKPVYLRGFGRHEDSDIRGKGLDMALVTKDYNLLKWIGANSYRTSHYPYAEEIMDFADEQGIMIIDECPSVDTDKFSPELLKKHKDSLTELIQRDKNRPSVIMWSVANEPRTQYKEADGYFKSIVDHVKSLDNRPITAAIAQGADYENAGKHMDIIGFNRYNGWYTDPGKTEIIQLNVEAEAEQWHKKHNKPVILMEYGADTMIGLHLYPQYIWSEEYQIELLSEHFKAFDNLRKKDFFIGEMIWNFADFKTDQSTTRVGGNRKGIFTRDRQPKSAAYHVRKRYFQLAFEIDNYDLPDDLTKYTASISTIHNNRIEL
ncbi:hypothetical protein AAG570_000533 [Ranatra chinensis]|uniref:Beta-glucuronidase n=1 Tax=Ranatra chinensis TaxID=642074 RepID=A0ABD0ZIH7_9HEMI